MNTNMELAWAGGFFEAKRWRAKLLIEARQLISNRRGKHAGNQYIGIMYQPHSDRMAELYEKIKSLNKRGSGDIQV